MFRGEPRQRLAAVRDGERATPRYGVVDLDRRTSRIQHPLCGETGVEVEVRQPPQRHHLVALGQFARVQPDEVVHAVAVCLVLLNEVEVLQLAN